MHFKNSSHLFFIRNAIATFLCLIATLMISMNEAHAQTPGIISLGNAAVTGFSGILKQPNNTPELFDLNGPSVQVITLPGSGSFGLIPVSKQFTVYARNVGQVSGIAIDNNKQPNIYVAATSMYGLAIYNPDQSRLQKGAPGALYMLGQFGPTEQGGGSTSIWRIDGKTGNVTLFANVVYNGVQNTPASLGGLAFDAKTQQLFVADRATGMIHRFSLDGIDHGVYDHGVQGLSTVGKAIVAFDATTLADINSPNFDAQNPDTWGFAPPARRVYAVAIHANRLYYSIYGPQIWSVSINSDGSFADDARFEVDSPALKSDTEISAITFDKRGHMYAAERGAPTGDFNFINVATDQQPQNYQKLNY